MKNLLFLLAFAYTADGCNLKSEQQAVNAKDQHSIALIPAALLTVDTSCWCVSPVSLNTYSGSIDTADDGAVQPKLIQADFEKNASFRFLFYEKMNPVTGKETYTAVEGHADFITGNAGRDVMLLQAQKGSYRTLHHGVVVKHAAGKQLLSTRYSAAYLWEKICFPGIPSEDFLLLVNLTAHPSAAFSKQEGIPKKWVSKFYSRNCSSIKMPGDRITIVNPKL